MRRSWLPLLAAISACFLFLPASASAKTNPADYPLRVHIVFRNGIRHYHGMGGGISSLEEVDGLGQANLFENGQPLGFDFNYNCGQPITPQSAFDTYIARWKKQGRVLEIAYPVMGGKPGDVYTCELKVSMKQNTVYVRRSGGIAEEPAAEFKQWMVAHQYDPEHGKNQPVKLSSEKPAQTTPEN